MKEKIKKERIGKVKINEKKALDFLKRLAKGEIKFKDKEEKELLEYITSQVKEGLTPGEEKKNLIEKYKNLPRKKPDDIVRVEGNLIEYPIATYSNKSIKGNWTIYKDKNLTRKVGSPEGPLTGFNEFQFYALLMYAQEKDGELIAKNTLPQMLRDMGLKTSGDNFAYGYKGLERLGGTIITTEKFYQAPERNHIPLSIYPFFKAAHIPKKGDKNREFTFIFNDCLHLNMAVAYQITTRWKKLKGLKSPVYKRGFLYFTKCWGGKNYYKEEWKAVAEKLGITDKNPTYKKKALVNTLEAQIEKGEMDHYTLGKKFLEIWHYPEKTETNHQEEKEEKERTRKEEAQLYTRKQRIQATLIDWHIKLKKVKGITDSYEVNYLEKTIKKVKSKNRKNPAGLFLYIIKNY